MFLFYDIPYVKEIVMYFLIPIFVVILLCSIGLLVYSFRVKDHTTLKYNYSMNFWSSVIAIVLGAAILAVSIGFSIAFTNRINSTGVTKNTVYYFVQFFSVIPGLFLLFFLVKFFRNLKNNPKKQDRRRNQKEENPALPELNKMLEQNKVEENNIALNMEEANPEQSTMELKQEELVISSSEAEATTEEKPVVAEAKETKPVIEIEEEIEIL